MSESQYLAWIRSALRSKWLRWKPRADALKAAQVKYKGDNPRRKYSYECAICSKLFAQKDVEVDHYPEDAGSIESVEAVGRFVSRLYCEVDNLRVVCKPCHAIYTLSQRNGISYEEAEFEKRVNEWMRKPIAQVKAFCNKHGYDDKQLSNPEKRKAALQEILRRTDV